MVNTHYTFKGTEVYFVPSPDGFGAPDMRDALTGQIINYYTGLPVVTPERVPTQDELVQVIDEIAC